MIISFIRTLTDNPGSLEEVVRDVATCHPTFPVKMNLDELAESRAVVVSGRLCISESFQDRVCVQKFLLERSGFNAVTVAQVFEDVFR